MEMSPSLVAMGKKPASSGGGGFGANAKPAAKSLEEVVADFPTRLPQDSSVKCACGSGLAYGCCCLPYHKGETAPETPERCLSSRYSGYTYRLPRYIIETTHKTNKDWRTDKIKWAKELNKDFYDGFTFIEGGLEVGEAEPGASDDEAYLSFTVKMLPMVADEINALEAEPKPMVFTEKSKFVRDGRGIWMYANGELSTEVIDRVIELSDSLSNLLEMDQGAKVESLISAPPAGGDDVEHKKTDEGRRLQAGSAPTCANPTEAWLLSWRSTLDDWWLALPFGSQQQVHSCAGALGLHLLSRLDARVTKWFGSRLSGLGSAQGKPLPQQQARGEDGCEWITNGGANPLSLPDFPALPSKFEVPPIPRLLPGGLREGFLLSPLLQGATLDEGFFSTASLVEPERETLRMRDDSAGTGLAGRPQTPSMVGAVGAGAAGAGVALAFVFVLRTCSGQARLRRSQPSERCDKVTVMSL